MSKISIAFPFRAKIVLALLPLAMFAGQQASLAQVPPENLRLPISLDADFTDYDGKRSMLTFRGLRLTQGNIGVEADEGRATKLDFEDSVWHFSGNVKIDTETGRVECDTADLRFADHQLLQATIAGKPATFELRRPESTDVTYAEAGRLDYDFAQGIVEFSENATITEGGNQISSSYLVYNIAEQRINAQAQGADGDRVKIIYTPAPVSDDTSGLPSADAEGDSDADTVTDADAASEAASEVPADVPADVPAETASEIPAEDDEAVLPPPDGAEPPPAGDVAEPAQDSGGEGPQ